MRAYLTIHAKNTIIPFDHRDLITQTIANWIGWDNVMGNLPPYSFSRFEGIKNSLEGIWFNDETAFFLSSPNTEVVKKLEIGVKAKPNMFNGLKVSDIKVLDAPDLSKRDVLFVASPLLLKNRNDDDILYNNKTADSILMEHSLLKLKEAGIHDESFHIEFDKNYESAGSKKITYNGNIMRASWCHVVIKGLPETKQYLWHVGLGYGNNIGFGAIM
ncbi:MAG: CRISPR-associated endoribonuclease Cas6 [Prolixibacteraceae bacterium]|jgi:CRISPR-associated endoribonuclease Cas6|nr:CRISPR-associated endoribonuclease Cas6 [Prolixibacteraceae bacterium]